MMSLNCKITPSSPPPTTKIKLGSALVWLVWKYICTMKNCCKGCSLCPYWFRNHSNTTVCPSKHNLLINRCIGTVQLIINIDFSYHLFVNCTYCYYFDDVLTFYLSSSFLKLNHIIDIYKSTKIVLTRRINVGYLIIGTCQSWKQLRIYQCLIFNFMSVNKSYYLKDKWIYHKPQMLHGIVDPWPLEITNSSSCSIVRMV